MRESLAPSGGGPQFMPSLREKRLRGSSPCLSHLTAELGLRVHCAVLVTVRTDAILELFGMIVVMRPSTQHVARAGQLFVAAELTLRGAHDVRTVTEGRRSELIATSQDRARTVGLRVKSKRAGDWQPSLLEAEPGERPLSHDRFWVFVDLSQPSQRPHYYLVPEPWIQRNIREAYAEAVARHGGHRERTPESTHHKVDKDRIAQW